MCIPNRTDGRAERERRQAAAGQSGLPEGYRHVTLRQVPPCDIPFVAFSVTSAAKIKAAYVEPRHVKQHLLRA